MPTASTPARPHLVEHPQVVGRLELDLDRQPGGLLDRGRAAADVDRAPIPPVQGPGGQGHVDRVVMVARRGADLGQLRRRLDRDRLLPARELDPAEPALLVRAPVDALLDHGRRDRVQVQQRDLPVRDPVRGLHVVDPRPPRHRHRPDQLVAAVQRRLAAVPPQHVRRGGHEAGVRGNGQGQPAHPQEQRIGRPGPTPAAGQRARVLLLDPDPERLELDEQPAVVERLKHGSRTPPRSCARTPGP